MKSVFFLLLVIALLTCCSCSLRSKEIDARFPNSRIDEGNLAGFSTTPEEHMIDEIETPFLVSQVKGVLLPFENELFSEGSAIFEIRGPDGSKRIWQSITDKRSRFFLPHVPEGKYVFKATASGWQSVMGIIIVDRKAKPDTIRIVMKLGV